MRRTVAVARSGHLYLLLAVMGLACVSLLYSTEQYKKQVRAWRAAAHYFKEYQRGNAVVTICGVWSP